MQGRVTLADAVYELLADGRARTVNEIVDAVASRLGSAKLTVKNHFINILANSPRLDRRKRPGKGRASFEYFLVPNAGSSAPGPARNGTAMLSVAIVDALDRGVFRSQDEIVSEVARKTGITVDQIRIRLTVMAAKGEIERSYIYRIPRKRAS